MRQILVRQSLMNHRQTMRLAKMLDEDRYTAAGRVIALWLWALDNAPDGVLDGDFGVYSGDVVGYAGGDSQRVLSAFIASGWIVDTSTLGEDDEDAALVIADWTSVDGPISVATETDPNQ